MIFPQQIGTRFITAILLMFAVVILSVETLGLRTTIELQYQGPEVSAKGGELLGVGPFVCAQFVKGSDHNCSTGEFMGDLATVFVLSLFFAPSIIGKHPLPISLSIILVPMIFLGADVLAKKYSWKTWERVSPAIIIGVLLCFLVGFHLLFWNTLMYSS